MKNDIRAQMIQPGVWAAPYAQQLPQEGTRVYRKHSSVALLSPSITILTLFVGRDFIFSKWMESLRSIDYPKSQTRILWVYAGNAKAGYGRKLLNAFNKLKGYHSQTLVLKPDLGRYPGEDGRIRHQVICAAYNFSRIYSESVDYTFLLEDDVIAPPSCVRRLLTLMDNPRIGCAMGTLRYRPTDGNHGTVLAWNIIPTLQAHNGSVSQSYDITGVYPQPAGVEEVSSGTFGCTLIREPLWRDTTLIPWSNGIFGTDVNFGHQILGKGYKTMIDWSVQCRHFFRNKKKELLYV